MDFFLWPLWTSYGRFGHIRFGRSSLRVYYMAAYEEGSVKLSSRVSEMRMEVVKHKTRIEPAF